jgi:hypothetical protein
VIYILIIFNFGTHKAVSANVEFNDIGSCRAAAAEVQKQLRYKPDVILCAAKGHQPNITPKPQGPT